MNPAPDNPLRVPLDLAFLAMYADGHLARSEDQRLHHWLTERGVDSLEDRRRLMDESATRVRRAASTAEAAEAYARECVEALPSREARLEMQQLLDAVVTSDRHVSVEENSLLNAIRSALEA